MRSIALLLWLSALALAEEETDLAAQVARHQEGSRTLAELQDELAADVQQLIIEQNNEKVIELLESVEAAMDEASELLFESDTGGGTIAAETEVIERIFEAAQERSNQSGEGGETSGAMLEMMREMMGKGQPGDQPGQQPGQNPGDTGGEGRTGDSDTANSDNSGATGGKSVERRVPKASGSAGQGLPREFQEALDAYNRAAETLAK